MAWLDPQNCSIWTCRSIALKQSLHGLPAPKVTAPTSTVNGINLIRLAPVWTVTHPGMHRQLNEAQHHRCSAGAGLEHLNMAGNLLKDDVRMDLRILRSLRELNLASNCLRRLNLEGTRLCLCGTCPLPFSHLLPSHGTSYPLHRCTMSCTCVNDSFHPQAFRYAQGHAFWA